MNVMQMDNNSYNIPKVTAGEAVELLRDLYLTAYHMNVLDTIPSVSLWGQMGVGKSAAVRQIAKGLEEELGQKVTVVDIRLLNFSPVDLRGIPTADAQKQFAVWLKPKIFDLDPEGVSILFLDEISAAPQSLQATAYQIALEKRIGEFELPKNCIVICAGNRTIDRSVATRMPKALANRLMHLEVLADYDSWYLWAVEKELDARIIGYLGFDRSRLCVEAGIEELAFPTPRSWEFVSRLLTTMNRTPEEMHTLLSGCIGVTTAVEFEHWCEVYQTLPSIENILAGIEVRPPRQMNVLYALVSSLLACISQKKESLTDSELSHLCNYASGMSPDFGAWFFRGALRIPGMDRRLAQNPQFAAWMRKNRKYL